MCDGTTKPIKDVEEGDLVIAKDQETGKLSCERVTHTINHEGDELVLVTVESVGGERDTFEATTRHPMITPAGDTVDAGDLVAGAKLGMLASGGVGKVVEVKRLGQRRVLVYNLTVEARHTFFVGESGVWAHNCDEYEWTNPNNTRNYIKAHIDDDGFMNLEVVAQEVSDRRASAMFEDAYNALGSERLKGIRGVWMPSMPSNLESFNAGLLKHGDFEKAAFETFTGKMASRRGFNNVREVSGIPLGDGTYFGIELEFY